MLVRKVVYNLMSDKMLNKRACRLAVKLQEEDDIMKKLKILDAITDAAEASIRKNRFDKAFMKEVTFELQELLEESGI